MNKGFLALAFAAGAAVGSAVTWKVLKDKYEQLVREEIESVKEAYGRLYEKREDTEESVTSEDTGDEEDPTTVAEEQEEYESIIHSQGYASYSKNVAAVEEKSGEYEVIPPDEVGIEDDYELVTWYMFTDGYMTDADEEPVTNWEVLVGPDVADHFGEWEDDSVFVRNDATKAYYEILKDNRKYMHVLNARTVDKYRYSEDE